MTLRGLRTFSIAREAVARQILIFGIISWQTSPTICRDADVSWGAGKSRRLPAFIVASRLPQCSTSTTPKSNRRVSRSVLTWLATLTRVSVRTGPRSVLRHAGLIPVHLAYRLPVSLAVPDEICFGAWHSRNLMQRCTKISRSLTDERLRLE